MSSYFIVICMYMDPSDSREMMCKQEAAMVVVMVSFVTTRLKRKMPESETETEPDPLVYALRDEAEQHRQLTLNLIYNSTDGVPIHA